MAHTRQPIDTGPSSAGLRPGETGSPMRRVATASLIGTLIEFYDFLIYGVAAGLVFGKVFFPALGPAAATAAAFATLGVAFVVRPFGSIIFGHFGDRVGRKKTLVATLMIMGIATVLVGLLPTAEQIGVAAPILLVILRMLQGLAAGGEWAGAVLFAAEHAPKAKRGFWAMIPSFGAGLSFVLANATFLVTSLAMSDEAFLSYGWRIPFLASVVLIVVGLYMRMKIDETPVFRGELARKGVARVPVAEAFRSQPRQVLLATGVVIVVPALSYLGVTYLPNYGTSVLHLGRDVVLAMGVVAAAFFSLAILLGGVLADRVGRRRTLIVAGVLSVLWSAALFPIIDRGSGLTFAIGLSVTLFIGGLAYGPLSAFISELFHTRFRYTATGFSYNVAFIIGAAVPPLVGVSITAALGALVFGLFLAALCLVSLVCVLMLKETRDIELDRAGAAVATPDAHA